MKSARTLLGSLIFLQCSCLTTAPTALSVVSASGRTIWSGTIFTGERFDITFVHSQEHCLWTQRYAVTANWFIEQTSSNYPCFGAGLPLETARHRLSRTDLGYAMTGQSRFRNIDMMNSTQANITLVYRGHAIRLSSRMAEFERFSLRVHAHR